MAIKVKYGSVTYVADSPEEAVRLGMLLSQGAEEPESGYLVGEIHAASDESFAWSRTLFEQFIERLGNPQKTALSLLVARGTVSDEYLREQLHVAHNQALAGVLSGISKQAAALGIPRVAIFEIANIRNNTDGRRSVYTVAEEFQRAAASARWANSPSK